MQKLLVFRENLVWPLRRDDQPSLKLNSKEQFCFVLLLLLLLTEIELSLSGSSPYTSTDKTNTNKYTYKCLQNWSNQILILCSSHLCTQTRQTGYNTSTPNGRQSSGDMTVCSLVYTIADLVNRNAFIFRKVDSGSNKFVKALPSTCSLSWSMTLTIADKLSLLLHRASCRFNNYHTTNKCTNCM